MLGPSKLSGYVPKTGKPDLVTTAATEIFTSFLCWVQTHSQLVYVIQDNHLLPFIYWMLVGLGLFFFLFYTIYKL